MKFFIYKHIKNRGMQKFELFLTDFKSINMAHNKYKNTPLGGFLNIKFLYG